MRPGTGRVWGKSWAPRRRNEGTLRAALQRPSLGPALKRAALGFRGTWGFGGGRRFEKFLYSAISPKARDYCLKHVLETEEKCALPGVFSGSLGTPNKVN